MKLNTNSLNLKKKTLYSILIMEWLTFLQCGPDLHAEAEEDDNLLKKKKKKEEEMI